MHVKKNMLKMSCFHRLDRFLAFIGGDGPIPPLRRPPSPTALLPTVGLKRDTTTSVSPHCSMHDAMPFFESVKLTLRHQSYHIPH
jgi:hypothetical protein